MNNKNVSVWRGDNTPPTQYHLWLKNDGKLYINIDEQWQEIDKDSVTQITEVLNQHATKLDNHQTALDNINTLHSKLWATGSASYGVMTQGVANTIGSKKDKGASGQYSTAEGMNTTANAQYSHAEGNQTIASANGAHTEGYNTQASGKMAHAEGHSTIASGNYSHAEGYLTKANGQASHASGINNVLNNNAIHSIGIGYNTKTYNNGKNAEYIYVKSNKGAWTDDVKNGYKYLIGIGGYDGVSTNITKYKSLQEVISDINSILDIVPKEAVTEDEIYTIMEPWYE